MIAIKHFQLLMMEAGVDVIKGGFGLGPSVAIGSCAGIGCGGIGCGGIGCGGIGCGSSRSSRLGSKRTLVSIPQAELFPIPSIWSFKHPIGKIIAIAVLEAVIKGR